MKCLWLTLADPDPPDNGQFLYSSGLIAAVAEMGMEVHVAGLHRPGGRHRNGEVAGGVRWWLAEHKPRSHRAAPFSWLPQVALRNNTPEMRRIVDRLLQRGSWDVAVFDSIAAGWALPQVLRHYAHFRPRPRLVYLSHNHEENVARTIAQAEARPAKRLLKQLDAAKVARLERSLARRADLVTSNSPDDGVRFRARWPDKPVEFLPPGYGGLRLARRQIDSGLPRRAIIVGTFDWGPKRASLESFLAVADPMFARAGIELYVVGGAEEQLLRRLRRGTVATTFTGRVDQVDGYMAKARLAVVPDQLGGFKLKTLDYVFHRLPILGIAGSVPGVPLCQGESIRLFPDHLSLARCVVEVIDDLALLNGMQERAYAACRDKFEWSAAGRRLCAAIAAIRSGAEGRAPSGRMVTSF